MMSQNVARARTSSVEGNRYSVGGYWYPASHWREIERFCHGDERDPRALFYLADDEWETWPYAEHGRPSEAGKFKFRFGHLRSPIKLYAKWYCYTRLLDKGGKIVGKDAGFTYALSAVDAYLVERGCTSLDEIAMPVAFRALWQAILFDSGDGPRLRKHVMRQLNTRPFWVRLRAQFGIPLELPPVAPHEKQLPVDYGADKNSIIPTPVIAQYVNKLALHRDGHSRLCRYDHQRLCILMLVIILGRRIEEILSAPRGMGDDGPLKRFPAQDSLPRDALWFNFSPVKGGPNDWVYISQEWEDIAIHCVQALIRYGDEVRAWAPPTESDLLILVSASNGTYGPHARAVGDVAAGEWRHPSAVQRQPKASGITYIGLHAWLHGKGLWRAAPGVEVLWRITADGSEDGKIYHLRFHQGRHTRQSAIALDNRATPQDRQRDLNHSSQGMQVVYQHVLEEENKALLAKSALIGPGAEWLAVIGSGKDQGFSSGEPNTLSPRFRRLIQNNPQFVRLNRVPLGLCALPQGPGACTAYMECLCGEDGGPCTWWCADPTDEPTLMAIDQEASRRRQGQQESAAAGRVVQAGKFDLLAQRAEQARDLIFEKAPQDLVARLHARRAELSAEDIGKNTEDNL